jgi:hypothetical protein
MPMFANRKYAKRVGCIVSWTAVHLRILDFLFTLYRHPWVSTPSVLVCHFIFFVFVKKYRIRSDNS